MSTMALTRQGVCLPVGMRSRTLTSIRPLPGRAIPYTYTPEEVTRFINSRDHQNDSALRRFLEGYYPPWGIIVNGEAGNPFGEFIVWKPAHLPVQVVDVTMHPIVREIPRPDFHSEDESLLLQLRNRIEEVWKAGQPAAISLGGGLALLGLAMLAGQFAGRRST